MIFLKPACSVCSAIPSSAARRLMPARIITASCVVKSSTCFIDGLPPLRRESVSIRLPLLADCFIGRRSSTWWPWLRSTFAAAVAFSALSTPTLIDPELDLTE